MQNKKRNLQRYYHSAQTSPLNNIRLQGAVHLAREHLNLQFSTLPKRVYYAYLRELNEIRYSPVALFSYSSREFRKKGSISVLLQFAKKMRSIMGWAHVSNTQGVLPDCNLFKSTGFAIFLTTLSFLWRLATNSKMSLTKCQIWVLSQELIYQFFSFPWRNQHP